MSLDRDGALQVSGGSLAGGSHLVLKSEVPHGVGISVLRFIALPGGAWTLTVCPSPISSSSPRAWDCACNNKVALGWREGSTTLFFSSKVGWYFGEFLETVLLQFQVWGFQGTAVIPE